MDQRGYAAYRLLFSLAAGQLYFQDYSRQQRWRLERTGAEPAHNRAAAVLPHMVVSIACRAGRRSSGLVWLSLSHHSTQTRSGGATDIFAPVDRVTGSGTQTDCGRTARRAWTKSVDRQKSRAAWPHGCAGPPGVAGAIRMDHQLRHTVHRGSSRDCTNPAALSS